MTFASILSDFWNDQILANEKQGLFLVLVGFILSFAFIRMSTRLMRSPRVTWWPGSVVSDSGVHVHHLVFGIVTMMIAGALGFLALGQSPYAELCAFAFGVGAGLTIDEFALWVYLDDVYWAEEGRSSIDATVIAAAGMMLILLGFSPFSFDTSSVEQTIASILGAALVLVLVAICFLKQRVLHGTIGFFVFPIAFTLNRLGQHYDIDPADPAKWGTLMRGSWFWDFAFINSNYHLEHHYFPGVPCYRLPELQRQLLPFYRSRGMTWQTYRGLVYGWIVLNKMPHTDWHLAG